MRQESPNTSLSEECLNWHEDYKNIYLNLIKNVDEVLNNISEINIQHIDIKKKNTETQSKLEKTRNGFVEDVEKLSENAVWDRYTIAFFGETNAGKSTIIESLRISMEEDEKLKNSALKKTFDLNISELEKKSVAVIVTKTEAKKHQIEDTTSKLETVKERAIRLEQTFWAKWFNIFRSWFGLLPFIFLQKKIKLFEHELFEINSIIPEQDNEVQIIFKEICELKKDSEELLDGKIIGTGMQDFTKSCIEYQFNQLEKPLTLIDVPGIEGNEGQYEAMIMDAVTKAHCVFYVCSADKTPESGTISKIKKYLKEQTEVYFLLNERKHTYNYDDVHTFEAMHSGAEEFRKNISRKMKDELGEFYKGCYSLQGLMAFCSKAEIHDKERNFKFQKKLLDKFKTREDLYSISQLEKIETLIRFQLNGMEKKIINANVHKAVCTTIDFKNNIQEIRNTEYSNDFVSYIEKEIKVVKEKNYNELMQLEKELNQSLIIISNSSVENLRKKLYDLVDNKENNAQLNDSDAKSLLSPFYSDQKKKINFIAKCYSTYVFDDLSKEHRDSTLKIVTNFRNNVKDNINKMQNNIKQITLAKFSSEFNNNTIGNFNTLFSFDWGKIGNAAMTIGGMALTGASLGTAFPGIGNVIGAIAGTVVGLIFTGVRWLMDKEYPESKAKKEIDEKLLMLKTEIKTKLALSNNSVAIDCKENIINKIGIMLDDNVKGIRAIQTILDTKISQLDKLILEVKKSKK
jgi:hypothetical protein